MFNREKRLTIDEAISLAAREENWLKVMNFQSSRINHTHNFAFMVQNKSIGQN